MKLKIKSITQKSKNRLIKTTRKKILAKMVCIVIGLAFQLGHYSLVSIWISYLISKMYPHNVMILSNTWRHICLHFISILPITF